MSPKKKRVLVTGANGFVGAALCERLVEHGVETRAAVRAGSAAGIRSLVGQKVEVGEIHAGTDWTTALSGVTHVVHLAARVHVMREVARDPLTDFRAVNTAGTINLARQAAAAGVKRIIYVSTIKVNGEHTSARPFRADDKPGPEDAYAQSKLEAELALHEISQHTGLAVVIVRPPLVYGPGVKGNFLSMLHVIQRGWPLPLASCDNRRSFIGLTNLASLLECCVTHPAAAGQLFLASDGEDLSMPDLLNRVARALGRKSRLLPFPPALLHLAARIVGRPGIYERLCSSLQADAYKARELLGWTPPSTVDSELVRTANWYLAMNQ
jgi:nucleoside-diphosphate-sugar epimerase